MNFKNLAVISFTTLLTLGACTQKNSRPALPPAPKVDYYTHSIDYQGETLAMIAKWYTGSSANWQTILEHNPGLDPKRLKIGMSVRIPRHLLIKEKAMPRPTVTTTAAVTDQTTPPTTPADTNLQGSPEGSVAKIQEDALKEQEQALKESEQTQEDVNAVVVNTNPTIPEDTHTFPTDPGTGDLGSTEPPSTPPTEGGDGTPQKASMTDLLKKMLGGKGEGTAANTDSAPPSNVDSAPPPPSDGTTGDGKVKSRDELLKELTQDY